MLYPKNGAPSLEKSLFQNPTAEYRATPFWAWNCDLDDDLLLREIDAMKRMGLGGFHMHSRSGMATNYLSDEFMAHIKACVEKARSESMLAWLYDEDRWPSGAAGGIVTKDKKYRARHLVFTPFPYGTEGAIDIPRRGVGGRSENGELIAQYKVSLDENGYLASYERVEENGDWFAYLETATESPWYNNQTYLDTLNPEAVRQFIQVTHDRYKEIVGDDFGGVVPAIFTDEPQFTHKKQLAFAHEKTDVTLPWTPDFAETFSAEYGEDILGSLPEVFWDLPGGAPSVVRYHYHDHVAERFARAFADQCGAWCKQNNIMLTGHMMEEPTLASQTAAIGDAMRSYRSFQLPGIDMLCDWREYTTAKQAQSATRQYGYPGVLSELYGVTNWDFDFRGHKLQGDWQAALGVTVRVPHLTWVSMAGEAKRDYPACIGYQSPWYEEYPLVEDHFARLNTALTRGKAHTRVAVVHPVESYWLKFGPNEQTALAREEMDRRFSDLTKWLLFGQVDFDFLAESLLPDQCPKADAPLRVGEMAYDCVIVPWCETLRSTTRDRLQDFAKAGGKLVVLGEAPKYIDARPDEGGATLAKLGTLIPYDRASVLSAVEPLRDIEVRDNRGRLADGLLYQMREDGDGRWLFLCHGAKPAFFDVLPREDITVRIKGTWNVCLFDTMTGSQSNLCGIVHENGWTVFRHSFYAHDSLLLWLSPTKAVEGGTLPPFAPLALPEAPLGDAAVTVRLSEPNVLVLDVAQYKLDDGAWQPDEEILRADNACRKQLSWPMRKDAFAQPWVVPEEPVTHTFHARFAIKSEIEIVGAKLAIEDAERVEISLNGVVVSSAPDGYFTDESIKTVALPTIPAGTSTLQVSIPFGRRANVEWCYLLGNFGVRPEGPEATLIPPRSTLSFGDITAQGLPFYAGNVTYDLPIELSADGALRVTTPHYRGALIGVELDGKRVGSIVYAPYSCEIPGVKAGTHTVSLTLFGTRINAFGQLHNADEAVTWFGPDSWRTTGAAWTYERRVKRVGILAQPSIEIL